MKNIYKSIVYIAAAIAMAGCAKQMPEGTNTAEKRYFDAWLYLEYKGALKPVWNGKELSGPDAAYNGIYIVNETPGNGETVVEDGYAIVEYRSYDLKGNLTEFSDSTAASQMGSYNPATYYGPEVWLTYKEAIPAGVREAMLGMKAGGSKKVIIPSWFMTYSSYDTTKEFFEHSGDFSDMIYEFTIKDFTKDISKWETRKIEDYMIDTYGTGVIFDNDTTGYYMISNKTYPSDTLAFPKDTTIYINYTGKLLNGLVFDTTSERVAKDNDIYSSTKDYSPVMIKWSETAGEISMGSDETTVIPGFSRTLWKMRYSKKNPDWKDSVTGIFTSSFGYGYNGSGSSIPSYAPLIFEIEVVDKPAE
jgi:FKBP-type peptidyl-prolyl cis-trans isomerase FklB